MTVPAHLPDNAPSQQPEALFVLCSHDRRGWSVIMRKPLQTRENDRLGAESLAPEAVNSEGRTAHQLRHDRRRTDIYDVTSTRQSQS